MIRSLTLLVLLTAVVSAHDKKPPPRLSIVLPLTVEPGKKTTLTLRGQNFDGVTEVRLVEGTATTKLLKSPKRVDVPNNLPVERIGDWTAEVELDLPEDTPGGTITLVVVGPGGESNTVKVAVADETPRVTEMEPNEGFATAQTIPVPCVVEGAISRERDVDVFRFEGATGDALRLEVQAARLGSPLDAMLTVYDANGRIVAAADDTDGTPDPIITLTLPRAGVYFVTVIEANDLGGPAFAYRLVIAKQAKK
jgi:hypothetical protein